MAEMKSVKNPYIKDFSHANLCLRLKVCRLQKGMGSKMIARQELTESRRRKRGADRQLRKEELQTIQVSDFCKRRLLNYADTFYELSKSYDSAFPAAQADRYRQLADRRVWESCQVIRKCMREMAKIMTEAASEVICFYPMEEKKKRMIAAALKQEGIRAEDMNYLPGEEGHPLVALTLSTHRRGGIAGEDVADMLSVLLDKRLQLTVSSPGLVEEEPHTFLLEEEAGYLVLTGFSRATKENETVSGDNFAVLEAEKGRVTVMISDGTGSGEQAGTDSGKVLDLMEKMIEAGYETDTAVNLVNTALFAAGEDRNHPTLDICDINLHQGRCRLHKIGGSVTFLKREDEVEQLRAGTLPLGIFQQIEIPLMERQLQDGDYLIMVSDGVVDALGERAYEETLAQIIRLIPEKNPSEIAEKILREVIYAGGGRILDDMTVGVIGIWENSSYRD